MSWAERSTGISPTITQFLFAHMLGRIDSIEADIARDRRADLIESMTTGQPLVCVVVVLAVVLDVGLVGGGGPKA
jgi:hypothetical protein